MKLITILGSNCLTGAYLLWVEVQADMVVRFGRYQNGNPIKIGKGPLIYVGSAMANQGSMTLAHRLLRHATRTNPGNPQTIRAALGETIHAYGLGQESIKPPQQKKLHWNIDHLLDKPDAHLTRTIIIRSPINLEGELAKFLLSQLEISPLAPGLGAHDHPGSTHILKVSAELDWWEELPGRLVNNLPGLTRDDC